MVFIVKAAVVLSLVVGVFEALTWGLYLPPFTSHSPMPLKTKLLMVAVKAAPHVVLGSWGNHVGSPTTRSLYLAYLTYACSMQSYSWWLPYLFGIITQSRLVTFSEKLALTYKILPPLHSHLVPSAEHTVMYPLTVMAWIACALVFIRSSLTTGNQKYILCLATLSLLAIPLYFEVTQPGSETEWGLFVACGGGALSVFLVSLLNAHHPATVERRKRGIQSRTKKTA